jgi:hypothetical protein
MVTPEIIRSLYKESLGMNIKCETCGASEPLDAEFSRCAACQVTPYCSRTCQVTNWKASHKVTCQKNLGNNEAHTMMQQLTRKLDKLSYTFGPMMAIACSMKFSIGNLNDSKVSPRTHVCKIHLSDLPKDVTAFKPRLHIDKIELELMTDLPGGHLRNLQDGFRHYPNSTKVMAYFLVYPVAQGKRPFLRPVMASYQDNPFEHSKKKLKNMTAAQRSDLPELVDCWLDAMNEMVQKKRPDLFAAAKRN